MSKTLKKQKEIQINDDVIVVRKLTIREMMKVLEEVGTIPQEISKMDGLNNDQAFEQLPVMIASSFPLFANIIAGAVEGKGDLKVTGDWLLDNCGLDDALVLVETILEINNFEQIMSSTKKVQALRGKSN